MTPFILVAAAVTAATPITLEETRALSKQNAQVTSAQFDLERSTAQTQAAKSAIYPQIAVNGTVGGALFGPQRIFSTVPTVSSTGTVTGFTQSIVDVEASSTRASFDLSLSASQLIYDGGKWWAQIAQAGALEEAQAGQLAEQRLSSELEGVRRFYELLRAQKQLEVLTANVKRSEEQVNRAQALFDAGRGQKTDVLAAQVNLGNDRLTVVQQRARIADSQTRLAVWLAKPGTAELEAATPASFDAAPVGGPETTAALEKARASRPLIKSLADQVRAAESGVDVARGNNLPTLAAQVVAGRTGPSADPFFTDPTKQNYVQGGLNVRWDVFNGFRTTSEVQRADIERRRSVAQMNQATLELEGEVRTTAIALASQVEGTGIAAANLDVARKSLELAQARFTQGLSTTLEVRDAQLKLAQAELTLVQSRIDVEIARAALDRAMGTTESDSGAHP